MGIKWKTGDFANALESTKAIEVQPDLFAAYLNLGGIQDLGNLDYALASTSRPSRLGQVILMH